VVTAKRAALVLSVMTLLVFGAVFARWTILGREIPRDKILLPQLVVLAYDSFTAPLGPAAALIKAFEAECHCQVQVIASGDSGMLLEKMRLTKPSVKIDVVIGVDQLSLGAARSVQEWRPLNFSKSNWDAQIKPWLEPDFIPFDWAPLTFIYRQNEIEPPVKVADLTEPRFAGMIALQDPRTSSPGLQFLFALQNWFGHGQMNAFMKKFKTNIHSVSPSWSTAYGLFQRQQAKMAFSYLTSLVYHWTVEKNPSYQAVSFSEGHPVQVEYVGVPADCKHCELAESFVAHLLKTDSQKLIMEKNFMLPVVKDVRQGTVYEELPKLRLFEPTPREKFEAARPGLIESWQKSLQ